MKRIFITGASGFVGRHVIEALNDQYECFGIGRSHFDGLDKKHYLQCDLTDIKKVTKFFHEVKPAVLIHLAAVVHKNHHDTSEKNYDLINYKCSKHLFDLCRRYKTKIIFASTIEVYGTTQAALINEHSDCQPASYYAKSKWKAEQYLTTLPNVEYAILRFTPLYGKDFTFNIDKRIFLVKDKVAYYFKKGEYTFSFCSIHNVCELIQRLLLQPLQNQVWVVSDSQQQPVKEIIGRYRQQHLAHITFRLPYHLCYLCIGFIEGGIRLFTDKDLFLSKRNFKKLFASKRYYDTKLEQQPLPWNIEKTLFGDMQ